MLIEIIKILDQLKIGNKKRLSKESLRYDIRNENQV
jgi:hypothetical protein